MPPLSGGGCRPPSCALTHGSGDPAAAKLLGGCAVSGSSAYLRCTGSKAVRGLREKPGPRAAICSGTGLPGSKSKFSNKYGRVQLSFALKAGSRGINSGWRSKGPHHAQWPGQRHPEPGASAGTGLWAPPARSSPCGAPERAALIPPGTALKGLAALHGTEAVCDLLMQRDVSHFSSPKPMHLSVLWGIGTFYTQRESRSFL